MHFNASANVRHYLSRPVRPDGLDLGREIK